MFSEKLVGLRWSLVQVTAHTAISIKILCFYFLEFGMFIALSRFISPVSCPKHTLVYSTQNVENAPVFAARGVVRRFMSITFACISADGQTRSAVGTMFSEKLVGLRWSLVQVTAHTAISIKILCFYFLRIGMFIALSRFISPVSCPKHTLVYSTQNVENAPNFITRGIVRRYMRITFACISAGGQTRSAVGSMFSEKLGGLRWSLVQVTAHTAISIKILCFYFFQIGMFIALSRFISPVSCLKHTPVYSTQTVENAPNFITRGVVRRYMRITFACISAGGRTNGLGKVGRAHAAQSIQQWSDIVHTTKFSIYGICAYLGQ